MATEAAGQHKPPIGREVAATAKALDRAFTEALASAGGTLPTWLILLTLKQQPHRTQQEIARAVGIGGPTLTHHLDAMEASGLVNRARGTGDRRAVHVELTPAGDALFGRLRTAAVSFDNRLRDGLSDAEIDQVRTLLGRLRSNVSD
jgi:MarR family transcriptional regulator, transcriptional regulator for hemolysin